MDLKNIFDVVESFGVGFAIVLFVLLIGVIGFFMLNFIEVIIRFIPEILSRLFIFLSIICIIIILGIIMYFIGKFAKKPIKNKVNNNLNSFNDHSSFCPKCGTKLKNNAKYCDNCGEKI